MKNLKSGQCELIENIDPASKIKSRINILNPKAGKKVMQAQKYKEIRSDGNNYKIKKNFIKEKLKNIGSILTQALAKQVTNSDGSICFSIHEIDPNGIFPSLGIQNEDVICEINGTKITSQNQVLDLFAKLKDLDSLELGIQREGADSKLNFNFD